MSAGKGGIGLAVKPEKVRQVAQFQEDLENSQGVILVDYRGLSVTESNDLRRKLREAGATFRVVKNTLARRAAVQAGVSGADDIFIGPTAAAIAWSDPVESAKALVSFNKETGKVEIKGGILGLQLISAADVQRLADLPSRQELLAKVVGGAAAPLVGFASVTRALLRDVVSVFDALRRQREEAA